MRLTTMGSMKSQDEKIKLSHVDAKGQARMVDVSGKEPTERLATASAQVNMRPEILDALLGGELPKGDALAAARLAGIMAAKRTGEWIPLCHPLPVDWVRLEFERLDPSTLRIECSAKITAKTGVEMEAMVGVSAAALTLYDMAKAADKSIVIQRIQLERKSGGKSGTYQRE